MKRALVLAGGGARGSYQVGMLKTLVNDRGLDFSVIRGVSVGALNAAFLAQAPSLPDPLAALRQRTAELENVWRSEITGNDSVYGERPGGFVGLAAGADSLYTLDPLKHLLARHLSQAALQSSGRDFTVGIVSLVSGLFGESNPADPLFMDKLVASASIPVVFPFVDLKQLPDALVDGGVRNITPFAGAFHTQPDEIYVLLTSKLIRNGAELPDSGVLPQDYKQWDDNWLGTKVSGLDVLKRTVDILSDEVYLDDLRLAVNWNTVVQQIEEVERRSAGADAALAQAIEGLRASLKGKRYVPIYVLAPQEWFGEDNSSTNFSASLIDRAIAHGSEIAADSTKWLWPPPS